MKKTLTILSCIACVLGASAAQLTPQQALERVKTSKEVKAVRRAAAAETTPALTVTTDGDFVGAYVFNTGADGFVIVSGDDCALPLLGYSDSGTFDPNDIPPQLKEWLDFYAAEIKWAVDNGITLAPQKADSRGREPVEPLVKALWEQTSPFNDLCPVLGGYRTLTGCMATTMSQVMYTHKYPTTGVGTNTYAWNGMLLSANFAESHYDYDVMLDKYTNSKNEEANAAVAKLMYDCGVAVNMNYDPNFSGAVDYQILPAMTKFFKYDINTFFAYRKYFTDSEWNELIYAQLADGLPVPYCGMSSAGGHQFIVDGYSENDYFHLNWGWAGKSDGYYLLSALNPPDIGSGAAASGFNTGQAATCGLRPVQTAATRPFFVGDEGLGLSSYTVDLGSQVTFKNTFYNYSGADANGHFAIKLVDEAGNATYAESLNLYNTPSLYGTRDFTVVFPADLAEGKYTLTVYFRQNNTDEYIYVPIDVYETRTYVVTVADGKAKFDTPKGSVAVVEFDTPETISVLQPFTVSGEVSNPGEGVFTGSLQLTLNKSDGTTIYSFGSTQVILEPGYSSVWNFKCNMAENSNTNQGLLVSGNYFFVLSCNGQTLSSVPVTLKLPQATLIVKSMKINDGVEPVDPNGIPFSGVVESLKGNFSGNLILGIYPDGSELEPIQNMTLSAQCTVRQNEAVRFSARGRLPEYPGGEQKYFVVVYNEDVKISDLYYFTVSGEYTDGVVQIEDDGIPAEFYTLDGIRVENPVRGQIYIVKKGNKTHKITL